MLRPFAAVREAEAAEAARSAPQQGALAVVAGETRLAAADSATSLMHFLVVAVSDNRLVHHADKI